MVSLDAIAIFILATTRSNGNNQASPSYYESRILPIHDTWGGYFPNLYFVFGSNQFDFNFLRQEFCHLQDQEGSNVESSSRAEGSSSIRQDRQKPRRKSGRQLVAHTPQTVSENRISLYHCLAHDKNVATATTGNMAPLQILFTGNCTGEYFGLGPSCRFQEALRYFQYSPKLQKCKWFMFIDDDIYLRPFALASLLTQLDAKSDEKNKIDRKEKDGAGDISAAGSTSSTAAAAISPTEIALISGGAFRGLRFSKSWKAPLYVQRNISCDVPFVHDFTFAQPLALNFAATRALRSSTDGNAFTALQTIWGGSHDFIVGLVLWLYQIPVYSFAKNYYGDKITTAVQGMQRPLPKQKEVYLMQPPQGPVRGGRLLQPKQAVHLWSHLMFHKVMSFTQYQWNVSASKHEPLADLANMHDIELMLREDEIRRSLLVPLPILSNPVSLWSSSSLSAAEARWYLPVIQIPPMEFLLSYSAAASSSSLTGKTQLNNKHHPVLSGATDEEAGAADMGERFIAVMSTALGVQEQQLLQSIAGTAYAAAAVAMGKYTINSTCNAVNAVTAATVSSSSSHAFKSAVGTACLLGAQLQCAHHAAASLVPMTTYGVVQTVYAETARTIRSAFSPFTPQHCALLFHVGTSTDAAPSN